MESSGALDGIRVLDIGQGVAGPYAARLLAGYGADVIKVEPPQSGDPARNEQPFAGDEPGLERSGLYAYLNTNKRGVTLDLDRPKALDAFRRLVEQTDILVENFRPGTLEQWGIGLEQLRAWNPRLILTSISNFGQEGPYRDRPATELTLWATSGAVRGVGDRGREPLLIGDTLIATAAGVLASVGTVAALFTREFTDEPQHVDIALLDAAIWLRGHTQLENGSFMEPGTVRTMANVRALNFPVPCADGYVGINVLNESHWQAFCGWMGLYELIDDPRFNTPFGRTEHDDELLTIVSERLANEHRMELFHGAQEWKLPLGVVADARDIFEFEQSRVRGFFDRVSHPVLGEYDQPGGPVRLAAGGWSLRRPAPLLGQHNEGVFVEELGLPRVEFEALTAEGVI